MATISAEGVKSISNKITNASSEYETEFKSSLSNFVDTMNQIWASKASQIYAKDVKACLDSVIDAIRKCIDNIREAVKANVQNYNLAENEQIPFTDFFASIPNTDSLDNTNANLSGPNGDEVGLAEGHTISELTAPFNVIINVVNIYLGKLENAIQSSNAFSGTEQETFIHAIQTIKTKFESEMESVKNSAETRVSSEDNNRSGMQSRNLGNISALTK